MAKLGFFLRIPPAVPTKLCHSWGLARRLLLQMPHEKLKRELLSGLNLLPAWFNLCLFFTELFRAWVPLIVPWRQTWTTIISRDISPSGQLRYIHELSHFLPPEAKYEGHDLSCESGRATKANQEVTRAHGSTKQSCSRKFAGPTKLKERKLARRPKLPTGVPIKKLLLYPSQLATS